MLYRSCLEPVAASLCQGKGPPLKYSKMYARPSKSSHLVYSIKLWEFRLLKPAVPTKCFALLSGMCFPVESTNFLLNPKSIRKISCLCYSGKYSFLCRSSSFPRGFYWRLSMKFSGFTSLWTIPSWWICSNRLSIYSTIRSTLIMLRDGLLLTTKDSRLRSNSSITKIWWLRSLPYQYTFGIPSMFSHTWFCPYGVLASLKACCTREVDYETWVVPSL